MPATECRLSVIQWTPKRLRVHAWTPIHPRMTDVRPTWQILMTIGSLARGGRGCPRDRHLAMITERGRLAWQLATGYGQRNLIETTMGRYKALIGLRLSARGFAAQRTEAAIGAAILNRMLAAGRPKSVRRQRVVI
jgi:hypothetical protein